VPAVRRLWLPTTYRDKGSNSKGTVWKSVIPKSPAGVVSGVNMTQKKESWKNRVRRPRGEGEFASALLHEKAGPS